MTKNAPLGNTTKSSSTEATKAFQRTLYKMLDASQQLLYTKNHRVCVCCNHRLPDTDTITLTRSADGTKASYAGLMKCGDIWACPVCARKISEERRIELNIAVETAKSGGMRVPLVTLTHAHTKYDELKDTRKLMCKAWSRLTSGRWWQQFKDEYCMVGYVRAFETTHSDKNGWHVHWHVMFVIDPIRSEIAYRREFDPVLMEIELKKRWALTLNRLGGFASYEHGVTVTEHDNEVADYLAKFGYMPSEADSKAQSGSGWTESHEIAKQVSKRATRRSGRTPFQILEDYANGDKRAGAIFREYVLAMKGQQQLVWSNGLKDLLLPDESKTDQEIAEETESEIVVEIESDVWRYVVRDKLRGKLIDLAVAGDDKKIRWILKKLEKKTVTFKRGDKVVLNSDFIPIPRDRVDTLEQWLETIVQVGAVGYVLYGQSGEVYVEWDDDRLPRKLLPEYMFDLFEEPKNNPAAYDRPLF